MTEDPYEKLAHAIIVQAAKDYQKALRQLRLNPRYGPSRETKKEVEQFFHSEWFQFLTDADPDYIQNRLARADL